MSTAGFCGKACIMRNRVGRDSWGIHWFRRDLRVGGNPALSWSARRHDGRVLGLFCFDPAFLARPDFSARRFAFFLKTLQELQSELRSRGGDLVVLDHGPKKAMTALLEGLRSGDLPLPSTLSWNRDYEPFAVSRDAQVQAMLEGSFEIETHSERDHLLIEPQELYKGDERGTYYQVFTPFSKKWHLLLQEDFLDRTRQSRDPKDSSLALRPVWTQLKKRFPEFENTLQRYCRQAESQLDIALPPAGENHATARLLQFADQGLAQYTTRRDRPDIDGTSQLSIYLKNGSITSGQIVSTLKLKAPSKFLNEIAWREFYYHLLAHVPRVETQAFQLRYEGLKWENRTDYFEAWTQGKTGYPIVDAGMRQLAATGWMHNRVRMIVASFLTKDLHCDWKWGERHFMRQLLDGDLAPNNGGWQWAASTGCDAQPYFRVFNPTLQSQRFDPHGTYIRRWIPELAGLPSPLVHEPWRKGNPGVPYPKPIVEHSSRARQAIALYRQMR